MSEDEDVALILNESVLIQNYIYVQKVATVRTKPELQSTF